MGSVDGVGQQVCVEVPAAFGGIAAESGGEGGSGGEVLDQIEDTARREPAAPHVGQVQAVVVLEVGA
ncbi:MULTISPECIES: hypothetical protein [unclassified Streptomyces]|uniref:hypothetical protein n=1 Tax=unclassified Streptomyces TaxID=2593676 RepID=UPI001319E455|nr:MULTISPECIES: hypothetical protein [unclassified Streptomyces]MYT30465.1 hypothetical protein [Streptomyces sp. SID8354]